MSEKMEPKYDEAPVEISYTNWRGEYAVRRIVPVGVWFGATEWHPEMQWLLRAIDADKNAERDFAIKDIGVRTPSDWNAAVEVCAQKVLDFAEKRKSSSAWSDPVDEFVPLVDAIRALKRPETPPPADLIATDPPRSESATREDAGTAGGGTERVSGKQLDYWIGQLADDVEVFVPADRDELLSMLCELRQRRADAEPVADLAVAISNLRGTVVRLERAKPGAETQEALSAYADAERCLVDVTEAMVEALYEHVRSLGLHGPNAKPWKDRSDGHKNLWWAALRAALAKE